MIWTGNNLIEISDFLGHENFCHKKGVLIVQNKSNTAYINKGDTVEFDNNQDVINKIEPGQLNDIHIKGKQYE